MFKHEKIIKKAPISSKEKANITRKKKIEKTWHLNKVTSGKSDGGGKGQAGKATAQENSRPRGGGRRN